MREIVTGIYFAGLRGSEFRGRSSAAREDSLNGLSASSRSARSNVHIVAAAADDEGECVSLEGRVLATSLNMLFGFSRGESCAAVRGAG